MLGRHLVCSHGPEVTNSASLVRSSMVEYPHMHFRYAALLLCLSCSAPSATYERGTLTRPPAPARPGVGAPTYNPRAPRAKPEPNPRPPPVPHTHQTRSEPTIWASSGTIPKPIVLLLLEPVEMPDGKNDGPARNHMEECASEMNGRADIAHPPPTSHYSDMRRDVRICLAHSLMTRCLARRKDLFLTRGPDMSIKGGMQSALTLTRRAMELACKNPEVAQLAAREYGQILPGWTLPW